MSRTFARMRWLGIILPIALIWAFEIVRHVVLDDTLADDAVHVVAALVTTAGILAFGLVIWNYLDRTQRQLVAQNRDLAATQAVSSVARGGVDLAATLGRVLERLVAETGALAGVIRVTDPVIAAPAIRRPERLPEGLAWVGTLLDDQPVSASLLPVCSERGDVDTAVLDVPLVRAGRIEGDLRLLFHPSAGPEVSGPALAEIAGEIATAIHLGRLVADLRRRERERHTLYEIALKLTGRTDFRDMTTQITHDTRELLGADRAVVCLTGVRPENPTVRSMTDRLAYIDDGTICSVKHPGAWGPSHERNPECRLRDGARNVAWMSEPLRAPDGPLGELCVSRFDGEPFSDRDRELLGTLADLTSIAARTAHLHEAEQQWTIVSERDRIARELHDSLAQVLGVIHLRLRDLESQAAAAGSDALLPALADLAETADEAYRDVREAILGLRETISGEAGLEGALREYVVKFGRQSGIKTAFSCEGSMRRAIPPRVEIQLLRVVQEALTNVRKHSGASTAAVRVKCRDGETTISIEDDGVGFDPAAVVASLASGFGLASMRERAEQVGGTVDVHTGSGKGTTVVIRLQAEGMRDARSGTAPSPAG